MSMKKYVVPEFLSGRVDQDRYERWLKAKARTHSKGDVGRFGVRSSAEAYRDMLHAAVLSSSGKDCYTGEDLHWEKISTYNNDHSRAGKTAYKAGFALLPTADHVRKSDGTFDFVICGWRTNDSKSDLHLEELLELCERVLVHHGYRVEKPDR
ncbi:MAG TPA: hypothetical protein VG387_08170 [Rhizomicrobium sp.]|jgi:hypothetical protein|nr:hypothetical protein [Rhizomicrobium sp.]